MKITLVIEKINRQHTSYIITHLKKFLQRINSWINFELKIEND